jgi:hypothetical protein
MYLFQIRNLSLSITNEITTVVPKDKIHFMNQNDIIFKYKSIIFEII